MAKLTQILVDGNEIVPQLVAACGGLSLHNPADKPSRARIELTFAEIQPGEVLRISIQAESPQTLEPILSAAFDRLPAALDRREILNPI